MDSSKLTSDLHTHIQTHNLIQPKQKLNKQLILGWGWGETHTWELWHLVSPSHPLAVLWSSPTLHQSFAE